MRAFVNMTNRCLCFMLCTSFLHELVWGAGDVKQKVWRQLLVKCKHGVKCIWLRTEVTYEQTLNFILKHC
jgi:hypothetical protein